MTLSAPSLSADNKKSSKSSLRKPFTPKGRFDLEDEAKQKELDRIREELRLKAAAEKEEEAKAEAAEAAAAAAAEAAAVERGGNG